MLKHNLDTIVLKPKFGAGGVGINFIRREELDNFDGSAQWQKGEYILEEQVRQHSEMDKINPHSINSIRVITVLCSDSTVEFLGAMLRTSSSKFPVDNFTLGGIVIGIDMNTGRLRKEGFVKFFYPEKQGDMKTTLNYKSIDQAFETMRLKILLLPGKTLLKHPVTKTEFLNLQIPYWNELKKISIKAQKVFNHIKSIGWDFAITPKGPVIIEGNQSWGTIGLQAANGGLLTAKNKNLFAQYGISFYE
jgi:hypothetical protein